MMASKGQDVVFHCNISPVLFTTEEGEPMSFYLRPGPTKKELQPLIKSGGGTMCNVQKPGSILLIDPAEIGTVSESTAPQYVSIKYIDDCVDKGEQLNLEDYRMKAATVPMSSSRFGGNRKSPGNSGGRLAYSPGEDAAILNYVSRRKSEIKGNRLWQQMEKERVTTHSWQSMKARYKSHLEKKQIKDVQEADASGEDTQDNGKDEVTDNPSSKENAALPQTNSKPEDPLQTSKPEDPPHTNSADDLTQIDLLFAAEKGPSGDAHAQTSGPLQQEEKILNPPSEQVATAEAETCDSLPPVENTEPDSDQPQAKASPQTEKAPESTEPAQTEPQNNSSTSDDEVQPVRVFRRSVRHLMHRQLEDSEEEESYAKKLRSSSWSPSAASVRQLPSSPRTPKRTKLALSYLREETGEDEPPSKKAKGEEEEDKAIATQEDEEAAEVAESQQEDAEQPPPTPQAVPAHVNQLNEAELQQAERKKKRELGIIEMATKEFVSSDSDSESGEEVFQTPYQTAPLEPLASVEVSPARADPCLPNQEPDKWETPPEGSLPPGPSGTAGVASKAQPDGKDQEEDEEQVQLEEDKRCIRELMTKTNQDLVSVVKALLKTSGDASAALHLLSDPTSFRRPLWNLRDDGVLQSGDPAALKRLQKKYGNVAVSKRMMFLEVER
ncbi:telomeric repeat-binding factor 2-interacting protein 1 [Vanacampus margaritifer]